jgi:hypothetical protein
MDTITGMWLSKKHLNVAKKSAKKTLVDWQTQTGFFYICQL